MAKVLLVEDDINLREIYAARLSAEGHELVLASDGEEALSKAVSENPSLILLDIMMPKISGFDVLDILRSTPETENTKVVMLSALSQQSDQERGEKLGVDKYLVKSQITLEDVVETVKEMVEGTSGGTQSIVTTSEGRLPDEDAQSENPPQPDQSPAEPQQQAGQDGNGAPPQPDANNDGSNDGDGNTDNQAANSVKQPKQQSKQPTQAADEINDIDAQMQQNQSDDQQNAA